MRLLPLLLAAVAAAAPDPVAFPGPAEAKDPTGRYAVSCVSTKEADGSGHHDLNLKVLKSGRSRLLLSFSRGATVLWSPDGNALAVTERPDGDFSTVFVFRPDGTAAPVDLDAVLAKTLGPLPERSGNAHVYLEAVRWLDAKRLRVRLRGYGDRDPEGFDELFDYELGGRFRRAAF